MSGSHFLDGWKRAIRLARVSSLFTFAFNLMRTFLKFLGFIISVAAGTFISGFAAVIGAKTGGLEEGGWYWQFLPPLFYGWVVGLVVAVLFFVVIFRKDYSLALFSALVGPFVSVFIGSFIFYSVLLAPQKRAKEQYVILLNEVKVHPDALRKILCDARSRPLSESERAVIWQMVWVNHAIPDEDIQFILDYFERDGSALGGIMEHQNITIDQLRYLYKKHKKPTEYSRVLDELSKHPLSPPDVLEALATQHDPLVSEKARQRLATPK